MKLNILSDLHLGFGAMDGPVNDADVVVLAGDVGRPREAIAWALRLDKPVLVDAHPELTRCARSILTHP